MEWYYNGTKLPHGHRYRTFHDFGIVILDILYCYEENSGVYECRASNKYGADVTKATLKCVSKANLILDSQLPRVSSSSVRSKVLMARVMKISEKLGLPMPVEDEALKIKAFGIRSPPDEVEVVKSCESSLGTPKIPEFLLPKVVDVLKSSESPSKVLSYPQKSPTMTDAVQEQLKFPKLPSSYISKESIQELQNSNPLEESYSMLPLVVTAGILTITAYKLFHK